MKLTIFGASSATGKLLVKKALERGHAVNAFVRDETKLEITSPMLRLICGDALNASDVDAAVRGTEAVLSTMGPNGKPRVMAAQSTKLIVEAMETHRVKRLVIVSVAGVAVAEDERKANLIDGLIRLLLKDVFVDRENQLAVLASSNVDWVAVRVPRLTDDAATGSVRMVFGNPSPGWKVTRADLAEFMLQQLNQDKWVGKAPILSN